MSTGAADRDLIIERLKEELVGPSPQGEPIDLSQSITFAQAKDAYNPRRQQSGEEILQRDPPTSRYGVGVLFPFATRQKEENQHITSAGGVPGSERQAELKAESGLESDAEHIIERGRRTADSDDDEFDVSSANAFQASSIAVTLLVQIPSNGRLIVEATGGRYTRHSIQVAGNQRAWYARSPVSLCADIPAHLLLVAKPTKVPVTEDMLVPDNLGPLDLRIEVLARPWSEPNTSLITVSLVNRTQGGTDDEHSLFQSHFRAGIAAPVDKPFVLPYPGTPGEQLDEEEQSLALLYRRLETFAVGHGCAASWEANEGAGRARSVRAEALPTAEVPSITPDIAAHGERVQVPMAALAGLVPGNDGMAQLEKVINLYKEWIDLQRQEAEALESRYRHAAERNLDDCTRCWQRMRDGFQYLRADPHAIRAFRLANQAILLQQISTKQHSEPRRISYDPKQHRYSFDEPYVQPDPHATGSGIGNWRPFQIAFLLMSLKSSAEPDDTERRAVELIWFPTGGGKTEAYLGLTAFTLFLRRLQDPTSVGTQVLMRYTLRLLTAQQFQRASGLIAAMEFLRRKEVHDLGPEPFSIGIWLGSSTTPNSRQDARSILRELEKGNASENKLLVRQCPWCGAQMGPLEQKGGKGYGKQTPVPGYTLSKNTVIFQCPDPRCDFSTGLPVYVIDEDIYDKTPALIIGTVDKFAMLAWRPEARAIFGLNSGGERVSSPPGLIIQDELHLIAGPLGSMVGLYEPVIEDLCTDKRGAQPIPPKIVSSTATIRRYQDQIRALYARDDVVLFPPPALDAGDSFFGRYARESDGTLQRGRIYVGVNAPGLGSQLTAVVRSFSSMLQTAYSLPAEARDPWWTLMVFFNTLRELGTSLSLFQSDIPDYMKVLRNRSGQDISEMRWLRHILELTSRLRNEEVPKAMEDLAIPALSAEPRPVDVCLASSIIEVGIDVDRLSLMAVVSQPKTTSQYIQVTGRVGRKWWERPGLVVTIYSPTRPRDRSHYEKFRSYHERLYAQVEPTSVTPFSPPALERSLHAALIAHVRQTGPIGLEPYPFPTDLFERFAGLMRDRVRVVDHAEEQTLEDMLELRVRQWEAWERRTWEARPQDLDPGLMYRAGEYVPPEWENLSWPVQQSMRTVDAECQAEITSLYAQEAGQSDA